MPAATFGHLDSVTLLPLTTDLGHGPVFRIDILPTASNGLKQRCQVMIDKAQTVYADKIGRRVGHLEAASVDRVDRP